MKKIGLYLLVLTVVLNSCINETIESRLPSYAKQYPNTPRGNFDAFWSGINTNYVFFDIDPIDWDAQYNRYITQIKDNMSEAELAKVLGEMAYPLIDGHFSITLDNSSLSFLSDKNPYPAFDDMYQNLLKTIPEKYIDPESYHSLDSLNTNTFFFSRMGTIRHQIQYLAINSFAFTGNRQASQTVMNFIANPPPSTKGIILDLRLCLGGSTYDANLIPGLFTDKPVEAGRLRFKPGPGRYEYGPLLPFRVAPANKPNLLPCIVLVDQATISCGEFTSLIMSQFPQVIVMGVKTAGAMGDVEGENFSLPNGWAVQTAVCAWQFTDGQYYEGKGVVPDVAVPLDMVKLKAGTDNQLEAAINRLLP